MVADGCETVCWMNPPYHQTEIPKWIRKAHEESSSQRRVVVVALLPARTGSAWFHELVLPHADGDASCEAAVKFAGMTTNRHGRLDDRGLWDTVHVLTDGGALCRLPLGLLLDVRAGPGIPMCRPVL